MKKTLIFILLALFTGLTAFTGQSVNGPGIKEFASYEYELLIIPADETAVGTVPAIGLTGVSAVIASIGPITISAVPIPLYDPGIIPVSMTMERFTTIRAMAYLNVLCRLIPICGKEVCCFLTAV